MSRPKAPLSRAVGVGAYLARMRSSSKPVLILVAASLLVAACGSSASRPPVASPSPTVEQCPTPPFTLDMVVAVPTGDRPRCFGAEEITLRGWVFEERNPAYDCVTYGDRPMWLMCILMRQPLLAFQQAPSEWHVGLRPLWVAADPLGPVGPIQFGAADGPVAVNTWIEVTGHFDDPAAASCGPPGDPSRIDCAGTLVLTAVRTP